MSLLNTTDTDIISATPAPSGSEIEEAVRAACGRIAPVWPLGNFVAVNPYLGMAELPFADAAERLASVAGAHATLPSDWYRRALAEGRIEARDLAAALDSTGKSSTESGPEGVAAFLDEIGGVGGDVAAAAARVPTVASVASAHTGVDWRTLLTDRVAAWAAAYFDDGQASWRSADAALPLFAAWREEAAVDRTPEVMGLSGFRRAARSTPPDAMDSIRAAVAELGVPREALELYFHAVLLQVGGWSAYASRVVWDARLAGRDDDTLVQFLAVLMAWEQGLARSLANRGLPAVWDEAMGQLRALGPRPLVREPLAQRLVLQDAFDRAEQRRLVESFAAAASTGAEPAAAAAGRRDPAAQLVFCIDVRSEVFRRQLESVTPDVDTIGFAGFFGFPIEYLPLAHDEGEAQCPVLLTPAFSVAETLTDASRHEEAVAIRTMRHHVRRSWKSFKMGAISCFSFVGPVGLAYLPKMFSDAYGKTRPVTRPESEGLPGWAARAMTPTLAPLQAEQPVAGIPVDARVDLAEGALRAMSLTDDFAPLVLVVGHGAGTTNNPYDTGLDCGACGGHTGEANARVAVTILNDPDVRTELATRGITVPDTTVFVAAQHNTTTDEITVFDRRTVPATHATALAELEGHLAAAGHLARIERARRMGIAADEGADAAVRRRAADWAQVRPEWGLAGCRAFVVAPRIRTHQIDLGGRSFLHSYDWRQDEGFGVLELVMTAPMVVASWISLQYYASTVDNRLFGSGNKTLHNVVGRVGVLEGNAGDLRVGLPWQSVHDGERFQHEPVRLNVIIEAPTDAMNDVLARHQGVRDLVDNGWLHLLAMDDSGRVTQRYAGNLQWETVDA